MANQNPIHLDEPPVETEFIIPKVYSNILIYLTLGVELKDVGWVYTQAHSIYLDIQNLYPQKTPEPTDLALNQASLLSNQSLFIISHISRIHSSGNDGTPPAIRYTLSVKAGDKLIDRFQKESGTGNPADFMSSIKFKIEA